jgi:hypothetical protein
MTDRVPNLGRRNGCLGGALGSAALLLLAPFAVAVRSLRRWRRGDELLVRWTTEPFSAAAATPRCRLDLELDLPPPRVAAARPALTDTVIRIAELLRASDDVYHMAYRLPELNETVMIPVGPRLQELGERFALIIGQGSLAGRTVVWPTLPSERAIADLLDPFDYDPEAPGEPDRLMSKADVRWGMANSFADRGASIVYRLLLYLPSSAVPEVERLLERLKELGL